jgi:hypothetical protein
MKDDKRYFCLNGNYGFLLPSIFGHVLDVVKGQTLCTFLLHHPIIQLSSSWWLKIYCTSSHHICFEARSK